MDPRLTHLWLAGTQPIPMIDDASTTLARDAAREAGRRAGMSHDGEEALATIASELAHNQIRHARHGEMALHVIERDGVAGVEVIAADVGVGLRAPDRALEGTAPPMGSLGKGLAGVQRLSHELDIDVREQEGTCIRARMFVTALSPRSECGVYGRPCPGEYVSGDGAAMRRAGSALEIAVVDGLGHGEHARVASVRALDAFQRQPFGHPLDAMLESIDAAVQGTRGCVMALVRLDRAAATFQYAGRGNISVQLLDGGASRSFAAGASVLGVPSRKAPRTIVEHTTVGPSAIVVVASDGLPTPARANVDFALLRRHPALVAHSLVAMHARPHDDVIVAVAH